MQCMDVSDNMAINDFVQSHLKSYDHLYYDCDPQFPMIMIHQVTYSVTDD